MARGQVLLVCEGKGNFTPLCAHGKSSLLRDCIYWKGSGTVTVPAEGKTLCYSGPRRLTIPPGAYTLASLERAVQSLVDEQQHPPDPEASTAAVFKFYPTSVPPADLPPGLS